MYILCTKEEKAHPHTGALFLELTIVRRVNRKSREAVNHTSFVLYFTRVPCTLYI